MSPQRVQPGRKDIPRAPSRHHERPPSRPPTSREQRLPGSTTTGAAVKSVPVQRNTSRAFAFHFPAGFHANVSLTQRSLQMFLSAAICLVHVFCACQRLGEMAWILVCVCVCACVCSLLLPFTFGAIGLVCDMDSIFQSAAQQKPSRCSPALLMESEADQNLSTLKRGAMSSLDTLHNHTHTHTFYITLTFPHRGVCVCVRA